MLISLGVFSMLVGLSFLGVALYWADLACGVFASYSFVCALCEFVLASVTRQSVAPREGQGQRMARSFMATMTVSRA
jgi:hypothetical protein